MAGGEFRLGTDSIYMADDGHIRPKGTSPKSWITWLRLERKTRHSRVFSATYGVRKKEARPKLRQLSPAGPAAPQTCRIAFPDYAGSAHWPGPSADEALYRRPWRRTILFARAR